MSKTTTLLVTRHGETTWNIARRLQGHLDSPLSPKGEEQVRALGARLARDKFDHLYTSDLGRTVATANAIATPSGRTPIVEPGLRERAFGVFEGLTVKECRQRFPNAWTRFQSNEPEFAMEGGESLLERHVRVVRALQQIASRHRGQRVMVVGHGGTLDSLFRMCVGLALDAPRTFSIENASLATVEVRSEAFHLLSWGDRSHLSAVQGR